MKEWLHQFFGPTLCGLFFDGFHARYTAGLYDRIAPQDAYKSPVVLALVIAGAFGSVAPAGYNTSFVYPAVGLDELARRIAGRGNICYGKRAVRIDPIARVVEFGDGNILKYDRLVSTLPLNAVMEMTGLNVSSPPDPHSSVLVVNIGAQRGPRCPDDHWLYLPSSVSGFHRIGFYSAVDAGFLPASARGSRNRVSIYVERAYLPGTRPSQAEQAAYIREVVRELQDFGYIADVEALDPTWIEAAYTWSWPQSKWRNAALRQLQEHGIFQVGRYGRWVFQGIADSLRDGFVVGSSFRGL
jgi:protoporphyrinogen oxidase